MSEELWVAWMDTPDPEAYVGTEQDCKEAAAQWAEDHGHNDVVAHIAPIAVDGIRSCRVITETRWEKP